MNPEDARILREILNAFEVLDEDDPHYDAKARTAFDFMLSRGRDLTEKQRAWMRWNAGPRGPSGADE